MLELIEKTMKCGNFLPLEQVRSVFESKAALKGYSVHPEHVKVANTFVRPYTESRACFDFEVK